MNQPISSLDLPNHVITKLENAGFHYCEDIKDSVEAAKINIPNWPTVAQPPKTKTAFELFEEEAKLNSVKTLVPELDSILGSEVMLGRVTELCGFPGSGRTQTCLHLAVGARGEVVFIHTNKNLSINRLKEIARKFDSEQILEKMLCIEASDPLELMASVRFLENWLEDEKNVIKLLIIDSITWPLKQQPIAERTNLICTIFQILRPLASLHKFGIVITNDLTTRIIDGKTVHTSALGDSFYHLVNNRILLAKEGDSFKATVLKSVQGTQKTVLFTF